VRNTTSPLNELLFKSYITRWLELLIKFIKEFGAEKEEEIWKQLGKLQWMEGRNWIKKNIHKLGVEEDNAIAAKEVVRAGLQTLAPVLYSKKEYEVKEETPNRVVMEITGWCPILEACKNLGIEPEKPLEYIIRQKLLGMLQSINPKLNIRFSRVDLDNMIREIVIELVEE